MYGFTLHYDEKTGFSQLVIVMKKATYGNLEDSLVRDIPETYDKPRSLALSITKRIKDLHWGYVHGNVHPRNILLNFADYVGELTDITFMQRNTEDRPGRRRQSGLHGGGRWPYVAPEMMTESPEEQRLTTAADIYALGIILWQLISRITFPDDALVDPAVYRIEPIPGILKEWQDLYMDCLQPDPSKRPNAYTVYRRLEKIPENLPLDPVTLDYIRRRRQECDEFLANHRFPEQPDADDDDPSLTIAKVGDSVWTASVTRFANPDLRRYPILLQNFTMQ